MALCNMTTEMGVKCAYIQPDSVALEFLKQKVKQPFTIVESDPDFQYTEKLFFDVSIVKPQLAAPNSVDNVRPLSDLVGTPVDQAYIGSCPGGRAEDIAVAASILKDKQVNKNTRFVVVPAHFRNKKFKSIVDLTPRRNTSSSCAGFEWHQFRVITMIHLRAG